jgi:N-acetylglucosaminyl-diphospho-decaprenol L-rhamnosyltransferase
MTASPVREITAILVSWRDSEEVEASVEALAAARARVPAIGPHASLVVVDNGGGLAQGGRIRFLWPDASLLTNPNNIGLARAANQGARAARGDVLLFLNPDTRAQEDPFSEIAHAFAAHPDAVAVAPRLLDFQEEPRRGRRLAPPSREDQFTFQLRRLPTLASDARQLLLIDHLLPDNPRRRRERYAELDRERPFVVEQAAGAALAVRRSAFEAVGGFDERFFPAWFEDVDFCARLLRHGRILYWPQARFRHRGRVSSEVLGYARFLPIYYANALRYRERYPAPARWAYRALLATGMLMRVAALPLRFTVPRPRGEAALAYLRVFAVAFGHIPRGGELPAIGGRLP